MPAKPRSLGQPPAPGRRPGPAGTLGGWLQWAERAYARHGVALGQVATTAHDEALYLLLRTLGLPLDSRPAVLKKKLTAEETDRVEEVFRRRIDERDDGRADIAAEPRVHGDGQEIHR